MTRNQLACLFSVLLLTTPAALAKQNLAQAASDPTASLMSFQIQDHYISDYHNLENEHGNSVLLRSAIPFQALEQNHIFRVTLPVVTDSPLTSNGLSDMTVFDLVTFQQSWGRYGVGVVGLIPTGGKERGAEKWAAGPAIGAVAAKPGLLYGLFNQNIFTFAGDNAREDVNISTIQPILNINISHGWSVGASEMNATYDWKHSRWSSLPVGAKIAKLVKLHRIPTQFFAEYEYDFQDDSVNPKSTFIFGVKLLFPL